MNGEAIFNFTDCTCVSEHVAEFDNLLNFLKQDCSYSSANIRNKQFSSLSL